ncbi:hypothetical protein MUK42_28450 [Musa troglodytarum]|uniref:Myb/SANT-like DNA-binding domain-containing protein n=1 Tax=Musa troglodytarum TaxID=320322 RepID=A0A9E7JNF2_9LILI|nr:hypothetical protein MUK42_28450 [Musa troglodytarum]
MDGGNGIPGGMLPSSMSSGGLMGLDMSVHPHQQQQQMLRHQQQLHAHHMLPFQAPVGSDGDHQAQYPNSHAQYVQAFGRAVRGKQQQPAMSSEEEAGYGEDVEEQARRGGLPQPSPSPSPWQRMKWTDNMVRFLIKVVYRVGDDCGAGGEGEQQAHGALAKGKKSAAALQKKGKWKSVSRAMMENGFCVSPQQCEDKFNDLNKRYKRVNDLLGKGTARRVVENQTLLDTVDNLSPKAKEEARKLLNSKHLFFHEMCAYHHAGGASSCAAPPPPQIPPPHPPDQQQQLCFHHPPPAAGPPAKVPGDSRGRGTAAEEEGMAEEMDEDDDVDSEEDEGDFYEEEEEEEGDDDVEGHGHTRHCHHHQQQPKHEEGEEDEESKGFTAGAKRPKRASSQMSASPPHSLTSPSFSSIQQLRSEMMAVCGGGEQQQRQWLRRKAAELEEQRVAYQGRALRLERQRFKWLRFSSNKEREMERMKLDNKRLRLENDGMLLLLRQKESELVHGGGALSSATVISAEAQQHTSDADHAVVGN